MGLLAARAGPLGAFQKVLRPAWGSMIMGWGGGGPPRIGREPSGSAWARAWGRTPEGGVGCRQEAPQGEWSQEAGKGTPLRRRMVPSE